MTTEYFMAAAMPGETATGGNRAGLADAPAGCRR